MGELEPEAKRAQAEGLELFSMADIAERHAKRMDEARRLDRQLKKRDYALWATVNAYRRALRDVTHNAPIIDPARQESALAPCPIVERAGSGRADRWCTRALRRTPALSEPAKCWESVATMCAQCPSIQSAACNHRH